MESLIPIKYRLKAAAVVLGIVIDNVPHFMTPLHPYSGGYFGVENALCHKTIIVAECLMEHINEFSVQK